MSDLTASPTGESLRDELLRRIEGLPPDLLDEVLPALRRAIAMGADLEKLVGMMEHWFKTPAMALQAEAALRAFAATIPGVTPVVASDIVRATDPPPEGIS